MLYFVALLLNFFVSLNNCFSTEPAQPTAIFIYGSACAGKSTLAACLLSKLGDGWHLIDQDTVFEKSEYQTTLEQAKIDEAILKEVNFARIHHLNIIIASTLHQNLLKQLKGYQTLSVLIYTPLPLLIERDKKRDDLLHRTENQRHLARIKILQTFAQLYVLNDQGPAIDHLKPSSFYSTLLAYCEQTDTHAFFDFLCHLNSFCPLSCREYFDLCIHSRSESLDTSIKQIQRIID